MNSDDLDKILLSEKRIVPSPSLMQAVMRRVKTEASIAPRKPFPWIRFVASIFIIAIPSIWYFPSEPVLHAMNSMSYTIGQWILGPGDLALKQAILTALASLLGTLGLIWFSFRLAGADS